LTSRGDLKKKLEYAFALYDQDDNGSLTSIEVRSILVAMLDMLVSINIIKLITKININFSLQLFSFL